MNFRSPKNLLILSMVAGMLSVVLAIVTGTGTTGAYVFALLSMPALLLFFMWPERTRFFVDRSPSQPTDPSHSRTKRRRPRAL